METQEIKGMKEKERHDFIEVDYGSLSYDKYLELRPIKRGVGKPRAMALWGEKTWTFLLVG